jgi:drug/metabolite transporter (DMT)-like permease
MTIHSADTQERTKGRVYAGLVLTMFFWGSAFPTSKMLVLEVPPEVAAVLRFGVGSLLMMAILFRRSAKPVPDRDVWVRLAAVGVVGVAGFNTLFFRGLSLAPSSDAGIIIPTMSPVFTAMAGMLFLGEPARRHRIAGLAISLAGAVLFFWAVIAHTGGQEGRVWGDAALIGAAICWAVSSILSRPLSVRIGAMPAASWSLFLGSILLLMISSLKMVTVPWGGLTGRFWVVLAYVVAFPTVIAYILWMEGIRILGSSPATSFMFLAPVFALLIAAALLGERPTALQVAGGALMLLGVWLVNRPGEGKAPFKGRGSSATP